MRPFAKLLWTRFLLRFYVSRINRLKLFSFAITLLKLYEYMLDSPVVLAASDAF